MYLKAVRWIRRKFRNWNIFWAFKFQWLLRWTKTNSKIKITSENVKHEIIPKKPPSVEHHCRFRCESIHRAREQLSSLWVMSYEPINVSTCFTENKLCIKSFYGRYLATGNAREISFVFVWKLTLRRAAIPLDMTLTRKRETIKMNGPSSWENQLRTVDGEGITIKIVCFQILFCGRFPIPTASRYVHRFEGIRPIKPGEAIAQMQHLSSSGGWRHTEVSRVVFACGWS